MSCRDPGEAPSGSCFHPVTSWSPVLRLPMQPSCPGSSLSVLTPAYNRSVSLSSPSPPTYPPRAPKQNFLSKLTNAVPRVCCFRRIRGSAWTPQGVGPTLASYGRPPPP